MRKKGDKDRIKFRKTRSDRGKKREKYAGKKTKPRRKINGKFIPYVSKRKRGDLIKIWFWSIDKMSNQGFMNFNKNIRRKMHRYVYGKHRLRIDVDPEMINTKDKICELALDYLWEGEWLLLLFGVARNKYHCSARGFAKIYIRDSPEGLKARIIPSYKRRSLKRLWWYMDD